MKIENVISTLCAGAVWHGAGAGAGAGVCLWLLRHLRLLRLPQDVEDTSALESAKVEDCVHTVLSLVGGNVIPGSGPCFDVSLEGQRVFLRAISEHSVAGPGCGSELDSKRVWLEGFARAILVRCPSADVPCRYRKLREVLRSYVREETTHPPT